MLQMAIQGIHEINYLPLMLFCPTFDFANHKLKESMMKQSYRGYDDIGRASVLKNGRSGSARGLGGRLTSPVTRDTKGVTSLLSPRWLRTQA